MTIGTNDICLLTAVVASLAGAGTDIFAGRKIMNAISYPTIVIGVLENTVLFGKKGLVVSLLGALITLLFFSFLFVFGGMGAGDVKMMTAIAACVGIYNTFMVISLSLIFALPFAVYVILRKRQFGKRIRNLHLILLKALNPEMEISVHQFRDGADKLSCPMGPAIALGCIALFFISRGWA